MQAAYAVCFFTCHGLTRTAGQVLNYNKGLRIRCVKNAKICVQSVSYVADILMYGFGILLYVETELAECA